MFDGKKGYILFITFYSIQLSISCPSLFDFVIQRKDIEHWTQVKFDPARPGHKITLLQCCHWNMFILPKIRIISIKIGWHLPKFKQLLIVLQQHTKPQKPPFWRRYNDWIEERKLRTKWIWVNMEGGRLPSILTQI